MLDVVPAIEPLAPEWDALADRLRAPPFMRPGWIAAWWEAFGRGTLAIYTWRREGRLIGLLPLCRRRGALLSPTNWHTPEFGVLSEPTEAPGFMQEVLRRSDGAHRLSLAFVDSTREGLGAWRLSAEAQRFRVLMRPLVRTVRVEIDRDWDEYERLLSRNLRGDLRRSARRLREAGEVSFESLDGRERLDSLLTEGFRVESSGWKGACGTAIASRPETERFYRQVGAWAARRGWLRLAFLRLDGQPLAFQLAVEEGGVHYALKSGFEPAYRMFSPGTLLLRWTVERAFSRGLACYELAAVERYKERWANRVREIALFQAFAPSPSGFIDWAAFRYGRPIGGRALTMLRRNRGHRAKRRAGARAA